jgi:cell division protein FtsL
MRICVLVVAHTHSSEKKSKEKKREEKKRKEKKRGVRQMKIEQNTGVAKRKENTDVRESRVE